MRYKAVEGAPQALQLGDQQVLIPSRGTGAGAFAGALFDDLVRAQQTTTGASDLQASTVYAVKQALVRFGGGEPAAGPGCHRLRGDRCARAGSGLCRDDERAVRFGTHRAGHRRHPGTRAILRRCRRGGGVSYAR